MSHKTTAFKIPGLKFRTILFFILIVYATPGWGQWNYYRQGGAAEKSRGRPVFTGGYLFVNCANMEAPGAGACFIYKYDSAGTRVQMPYDKYIWSMQSTFDGKLLSISQERRCSYRLDTLGYFFEKIDTDGSLIASVSMTNGATEFIQTPDSGYLVFLWDNKTMLRFDKTLALLSATSHTFGNVQGSMLCSDGKIAIAHLGNSSGQRLSLINATGQMLSTATITFFPSLVRPKGSNRITAYANEMFYEFDYSLNLVKSFVVKPFYDYFVKNDTVYTIFRDSLGSRIAYGVYNSAMKIIFKTNIDSYIPFSLCSVKNSVAVLFEPDIISMGRVNHCLAVKPKLSGFFVDKAMMLTYLEVDSSYVTLRPDGFYDVFARLNYGVMNNGTEVNRYTISTERSPDVLCGKYYTWQEFHQNIPQSGTSNSQSNGFLQARSVLYRGIITGTYCAVVNQADGEFDVTPANNVICVYPYFDMEGISERSFDDRRVQVFPNPFESVITVISEKESKMIELYSLQGQVLYSSSVSGFSNTINLAGFPPGLYLLRVTTPESMVIKRVMAR
jgi:hypothetical protein